VRLAALIIFLAVAGCQCPGRCDGQVCSGCCSPIEGCLPGSHSVACGKSGAACVVCQQTEFCHDQACVVGEPGIGTGRTGGGGATGAGAPGGGAGGGTPAAGGGALPGDLNAVIGRPCIADPNDCPTLNGTQLACLPAPLTPSRTVCQLECRGDGSCGMGGACLVTTRPAGTCRDCLVPCPDANGSQSTCDALERCVRGPSGTGVCTPDCRLQGALCRTGQCQPTGLCSAGGLVSRCLSW
jgi:hypothetical protein